MSVLLQENNYQTLNHFYIALWKQNPLIWVMIWRVSTPKNKQAASLLSFLPATALTYQDSTGVRRNQLLPAFHPAISQFTKPTRPFLPSYLSQKRSKAQPEYLLCTVSQASCLTHIPLIAVSNLNWVTWLPLKGIKLERAIWNPVRSQIGKKLQYLDWKRSSTSDNLKPSVPPDATSPYVKQTKSIQHDLQSPSSPLPPHLCFCRGKIITKSSTRNNNKGPCLFCKTKFLF